MRESIDKLVVSFFCRVFATYDARRRSISCAWCAAPDDKSESYVVRPFADQAFSAVALKKKQKKKIAANVRKKMLLMRTAAAGFHEIVRIRSLSAARCRSQKKQSTTQKKTPLV
jgi:hypothetical protein